MKRCLITGASGFLGRAVVERYGPDFDVVGIGRQVDLRNTGAFADFLRQTGPDLVLHLAAHRDPDYCEEHPDDARALNVDPLRTLRETLPASTRIVFTSTDYVFDGKTPPYREESPRRPLSVYGATKRDAEDVLAGRPRTTIVRIPVLVGEGGFIAQILEPLRAGKEILLDDVLVRRPIWIRDVAEAMAFLVGRDADGVFHLSGPTAGTRYGLTVAIGKHLGLPTTHIKPSKEIVKRRAERPLDSHLATEKIERLGFKGFTPFETVVDAVVK